MSGASHQTLRVLDGSWVLDRPADVTEVVPGADVLAVVFGPDGCTVVRRDDSGEEAWSALWNGDQAHDVQATGMLSAIVAPLAAAGRRWPAGLGGVELRRRPRPGPGRSAG